MKRILKVLFSAALLATFIPSEGFAINPRWEESIAKFEEADKATSPTLHGVVITGSSSARAWNVAKFFPGKPVLNRGFGGSQISDVLDYFDRLIPPYKPATVVLYSGDNDLSGGKTPEQVVDDLKKFVELMKKKSPESRIILLPVKPSIARWKLWDSMQKVNAEMKNIAATNANIVYVETALPLLGEDGQPVPSYFRNDKLHLTDDAYQIWTDLVTPHLDYKK